MPAPLKPHFHRCHQRMLACTIFILALFSLLTPGPSYAEVKTFTAQEGAVSSLLIFEQAGFARSYGIFTSGVARMAYDDSEKRLENLKLALLMGSLVTNSAAIKRDLFARRAYNPDRENELSFVQSEPVKFDAGKAKIKGQLSLNGANREVTFEATMNKFGQMNDKTKTVFEDNGQALGFSMHASLKRSDFNFGESDGLAPVNDDMILMLDIIGQN